MLRHLNSGAQVVNARLFGMNGKNYRKFQRMLQNSNGIIYLTGNDAVRNLIRESKAHQLDNVISTSAADGMISMDQSLLQLVKVGRIGPEAALSHCVNGEWLRKRLALNS